MTIIAPAAATVPSTPTDQRDPARLPVQSAIAAPDLRPATHTQLRQLNDSFTGITTLLVTAGIGLYRFVDQEADPQLKAVYDILQVVVGFVDDRAEDEAEDEGEYDDHAPATPRAEAAVTPAPAWWPQGKPHLVCCDGDHDADPRPADRMCFGPSWNVDLSLPAEHDEGQHFQISVQHHADDDAPKVWLGVGDSGHGRYATAAEARALAAALAEAADLAEGAR